MHRAQTGTGEHRVGRFWDHGQIKGDAVTLFDASVFQNASHGVHVLAEFLVGDLQMLVRVIAFPDDRDLVAARCDVAIHTVGRHVERAVLEPFDRDIVRIVAGVLHLGVGLDPVEPLSVFAPEALGVLHRLLVHLQIFVIVDQGGRCDGIGHGINFTHVGVPFVRSPQTSRFDVSVGPLKNGVYLTCATLLGEGLAASLPCFLSPSTAVQQDKAPCPLVE
jgi:hypothetical protein